MVATRWWTTMACRRVCPVRRVGGQLNRLDGAGLLGMMARGLGVAGNAEGQQSFKGAGSKSGRKTAAGARAKGW